MFLCLGLLGAFATPAAAATVTTDLDSLPPEPGELRYEINNATPGETVTIAPGIDPGLEWGVLLIDKDLILEGQSPLQTNIRQEPNRRIILVGSMDPTAVVTIRNLALAGAEAANGGPSSAGESGGAIENRADLTLDRLWFFGNSAGDGGNGANGANGPTGGPGGPGTSGGFGGGVLNTVGGDLTVISSTFEGNHAGDGGDGGNGGNTTAMMGLGGAGSGGAGGAGQSGGAISNAGEMTVTNSTFVNNTSGTGGDGGDNGNGLGGLGGVGGKGGDGGAIHQAGAGSLTITNSTIAGNVASAGGPGGMGFMAQAASGADGSGGGSFFFVGVTVGNTLYSQNTATTGSNCAGGGTITAVAANLSFPAGGCPASFSTGNPQLGFIMGNGGPTRTMALGTGSAAIDTGGLSGPATDQRGVSRPQGARCDIGAFELEAATIPGSTCAGPPASPASPLIPPATPLATGSAPKKCKKGRKLNKKTGRCVKKKKRR
jgi:hypothetical protein